MRSRLLARSKLRARARPRPSLDWERLGFHGMLDAVRRERNRDIPIDSRSVGTMRPSARSRRCFENAMGSSSGCKKPTCRNDGYEGCIVSATRAQPSATWQLVGRSRGASACRALAGGGATSSRWRAVSSPSLRGRGSGMPRCPMPRAIPLNVGPRGDCVLRYSASTHSTGIVSLTGPIAAIAMRFRRPLSYPCPSIRSPPPRYSPSANSSPDRSAPRREGRGSTPPLMTKLAQSKPHTLIVAFGLSLRILY
jgi:hypothetical protein